MPEAAHPGGDEGRWFSVRGPAHATKIKNEIKSCYSEQTSPPAKVYADLAVVPADQPGAAAARRAALDETAGREYVSDRESWTRESGSDLFRIKGLNFGIAGTFTVPRSPQPHPVILQAGDSEGGREFAARAGKETSDD